mmetsp:Transcript_48946/g.104497  ORF Transcript_48946/g.104497 Transcript_48946/m.104497 type:complete len:106 (+) Transcript_48946:582-899(+)
MTEVAQSNPMMTRATREYGIAPLPTASEASPQLFKRDGPSLLSYRCDRSGRILRVRGVGSEIAPLADPRRLCVCELNWSISLSDSVHSYMHAWRRGCVFKGAGGA